MNETSRISSSRALHGSRPSTDNFPSYDVRQRIASSAVVLPAPLGPMSPRMRPSSTRRSTLSNATVVPKVLRRPRASIVAINVSAPSVWMTTGELPQHRVLFVSDQAAESFPRPWAILRQETFGVRLLAEDR